MVAAQQLAHFLTEYFASDAPLSDVEDHERFRAQMLLSSGAAGCGIDRVDDETEDPARRLHSQRVLVGLAHASYVDQLAVVISTWYLTKEHPMVHLPPPISGVVEAASSLSAILSMPYDVVASYVEQVFKDEDKASRIAATAAFMLKIGGSRGVLTLLGFRQTIGSRNIAPLTRAQCVHSFSQIHGKATLTVGARAFTKHCQRSSDGWWGELKGNDATKNRVALAKVNEILDTAVWKNIHSLPHAHVTMELRNALGFGARWTIEDQAFRGFLEPQMANGHESRWRH